MTIINACPRCQEKWHSEYGAYICRKCPTQYRDETYRFTKSWLGYWAFLKKGDYLWFNFDVQRCSYNSKGKIIDLPLLPITITPAQLKNYLVFL